VCSFKDKAQADYEAVRARVHALLASLGRPVESIKDDYIHLACKNAWFWTLLRFRSVSQEHEAPKTGPICTMPILFVFLSSLLWCVR
jgi:hypothetical protein